MNLEANLLLWRNTASIHGDHPPIAVPPCRIPPAKCEILRNEIDRMLEEGIIEECKSPWEAPLVLVPKKDGGVRVCIDYRQLNRVTVPDHYPLPRMDDLLHVTVNTAFISTFDMRSGYHQVPVRESDKDETAWITPFGVFRFRVMPFGLRNAGATFQRLVDRLRALLWMLLLLAYLDDLAYLSKSFLDHLEGMRRLFEKLREFGLRLNRTKCNLCCERVKFLGHLITPQGLQSDPEKVRAIIELP